MGALLLALFLFNLLQIQSSPINYQHVKFIKSPNRPQRSYFVPSEIWTSENDLFHFPDSNSIEEGHITPDFSNGLDYPDPILLKGMAARRAVALLYSHELFFGDIPHVRALLYNQEQRKRNGLEGNRLGSLRPHLPFHRFKNFRYF